MLITPPSFQSLSAPIAHDSPRTYVFRSYDLLVRDDDAGALPDPAAVKSLGIPASNVFPVGVFRTEYCCAAWVEKSAAAPPGFTFRSLRALFAHLDEEELSVAGRALQIADWARNHRYCGACGKPMVAVTGERAMRCECGHTAYPRIAPAMMVLVKRGEAILLARNVAVPPGGRMSALAGFLEPGESVEDAIHREVREEVGLFVKDLRYFASQSWPFPGSLMIAFTAEYAGGEIVVDPREIAEAHWFGPGDKFPDLPPAQSISRALIEANLPRR
ncbi:MAG TPA: NAD(+) diphosphatase [Usitatibacter sp.]|nr:NAD(+) diphosphatase [Usitatibacter sp.]